MTNSIEHKVREIVAQHLAVRFDEALPTAKFTDLGCDSMDCVGVLILIEDEFAISITDDESDGIETVQQLIDLVTDKTK